MAQGHGIGRGAVDQEYGVPLIAVSITHKDSGFQCENDFVPVYQPGLHLPGDMQISALSSFELYSDDKAIDMLITSALSLCMQKSEKKANEITTSLTKEEVMGSLEHSFF